MKRNQTDFINNLGIGVFTFIVIIEFCGLIEYVLQSVLIITKTEPKLILWLTKILSLILFSIILIWIINKYNKPSEIDTRKTLIRLIIIFFGILSLQFLYAYFGTDYLLEKYQEEFDLYQNAPKGSLKLRGYLEFIPILNYLIFGIILLTKRKTVANTV